MKSCFNIRAVLVIDTHRYFEFIHYNFFFYCLNFCLYQPLKGSHGDQPGHSERWYKPGTPEAATRVHQSPSLATLITFPLGLLGPSRR